MSAEDRSDRRGTGRGAGGRGSTGSGSGGDDHGGERPDGPETPANDGSLTGTGTSTGTGTGIGISTGIGTVTVVHVMRHGEVENPGGVLYGRLPGYHLSELGRRMADRVAEHLADRDIAHVVASPLERAQETAAPVAKSHGLDVACDEGLIEADNVFQGKTVGVGDGALRRPANWRHLFNPFRPSWGESYMHQVLRMRAALDAARDAARGREAVCVSHQLPIWTLRSFVERRRLWHDPRRRQCTLASLTTFTFHGDEIVSVGYTEPARDLVPPHLRAGARRTKGGGGRGA